MTILGKILIFFVLIFCLVAGGLMIVVYATSRNYADAYAKAGDRLIAVESDRKQYAEEAANVKQAKDQLEKDLRAQLDAEKKKTADANKALADEKKLREAKEGELAAKGAAIDGSLGSAKSRGEEVAILQKQIGERDDTIRLQREELDVAKDETVRADIERKTYQARNLQLENELRDMARQLAQARNSGTTGVAQGPGGRTGKNNPPPDNAEGRIRSIDQSGNLLTITIGSDAGLAEGHTLQVFRLGPSPKYLGTVEILSVRPHEAVARPTKKGMPIQVDDRVAGKIQVGGSN